MKGDIVFVRFPYTDMTIAKPRPALVLHEEKDEVVLAYISSRVPVVPSDTDVLVLRRDSFFEATGLKRDSVIKLSVLTTLKKWFIEGLFGEVDSTLKIEINAKLAHVIDSDSRIVSNMQSCPLFSGCLNPTQYKFQFLAPGLDLGKLHFAYCCSLHWDAARGKTRGGRNGAPSTPGRLGENDGNG